MTKQRKDKQQPQPRNLARRTGKLPPLKKDDSLKRETHASRSVQTVPCDPKAIKTSQPEKQDFLGYIAKLDDIGLFELSKELHMQITELSKSILEFTEKSHEVNKLIQSRIENQ
jgi:hypothetical protein